MPLTPDQTRALIDAVRDVAATEILPRFRNLGDGDIDAKTTFDDLVTVADRAAEDALTARIHEILPGDTVVGEEAVSADPSLLATVGTGRVTVIDPIDGTWNFAHGLANYGVILSVVEDGVTQWGLLYDPSFDDWVEAHLGQGATYVRNGKARPLAISQAEAPLSALRGSVGFYLYPERHQPALAATTHRFRRASSLGASLHEYRMQALGGVDFCLNGKLNVWDHGAGVLILQEAGAVARLLDGSAYAPTLTEGYLLTARTEAMWQALADVFNDALAASAPPE
ncbi:MULTISPECIES: inositol monophosphatase [Jannaschia]|nr:MULTISPECIES: inositol monophosphatase [unclassified Jannaschia]